MDKDCIFCKIVKGELPAKFIIKGENFVCFKNIYPVAPVHVLIIPKKHIKNLSEVRELDKDVLAEIQISIPKIAKKLGIFDSFRLLSSNGKDAGQTINHLHYHLVGGWKKSTDEDMGINPGSLKI